MEMEILVLILYYFHDILIFLLDIVATSFGQNSIAFFAGLGSNTFAGVVLFPAQTNPTTLSAVDMNKDGTPDIVCSNFNSNSISVFISNGAGSPQFQDQVIYATGSNPYVVSTGDVNNDGEG